VATTSDERLLLGLMLVTVLGRVAPKRWGPPVRPARGARRRRAGRASAPPPRRDLAKAGVRFPRGRRRPARQPPAAAERQPPSRPEAAVDARRADVVTTTLQRSLDLTDLDAGLRAHADALRKHRRAGPAGSVGPARDRHGRDEDCRNGGDEVRPDCQGGQLDSHELSLLKRLKERRSAQRAPTRTVTTRNGRSARPL
jgi:hypothetical protein